MFKFDEYTVKFKHVTTAGIDPYDNPIVSRSKVKRWVKEGTILPYKAKTVCTIFKTGQETPVASGVVMLAWFDKFDQQHAVEKSFARAVLQLYPFGPEPKAVIKARRRDAWVQFAKHHKSYMGQLSMDAWEAGVS